MNIAVLSMSMNVYSTQRIVKEAERMNHTISQIDYTKCALVWGHPKPAVYYNNQDISASYDAVIPRIGSTWSKQAIAVVAQLETNGIFSSATALGIAVAKNKLLASQTLHNNGVPMPLTLACVSPSSITEQLHQVGGVPVIIKVQEGTQGVGVMLAETIPAAKAIVDTMYSLNTPVLVQEFIQESNGEDIRVFIIDNKIVASMKRSSAAEEFRSNLHRGGKGAVVTLTHTEQEIALAAVKCLGLGVAGVDLIRAKRGPLVLEVNASPGLQGIEQATGINIAKRIIQFVEKNGNR